MPKEGVLFSFSGEGKGRIYTGGNVVITVQTVHTFVLNRMPILEFMDAGRRCPVVHMFSLLC